MLPTIATGNVGSAIAGGYEVANSLRLNNGYNAGGDDAYMHRTPGSAGNRRTFTLSAWIKRGAYFNDEHPILAAADTTAIRFSSEGGSNSAINIYFYSGGWVFRVHTNALYRDPSAWMHLVVAFDTTQGTASNRIKIYVNGTQVTSLGNADYPTEDYETAFNNDVLHSIGRNANSDDYYEGYLSEVVMIDGLALAPTSFGEFNEDSPNIWQPIDVSGLTFGTNGFYLDFEDSSNLGNDASGGTDFTEVNLAATDQATDTPTNNFATLNPLAQTTTKGVLSEGNLEFDNAGASDGWEAVASTIAVTSGKWYFEYKVIDGGDSAGNGSQVGFLNYDVSNFQDDANSDLAATGEYGWYGAGNTFINGSDAGVISNYTDADIVMVAMDLDNSKAYWGKNGTWVNSGDPTSGATGTGGHTIVSASSNAFAIAVAHREGGNGQANFGNPPYANSSSAADANGYGAFEYAPPSGYFALCTKNLAEYG